MSSAQVQPPFTLQGNLLAEDSTATSRDGAESSVLKLLSQMGYLKLPFGYLGSPILQAGPSKDPQDEPKSSRLYPSLSPLQDSSGACNNRSSAEVSSGKDLKSGSKSAAKSSGNFFKFGSKSGAKSSGKDLKSKSKSAETSSGKDLKSGSKSAAMLSGKDIKSAFKAAGKDLKSVLKTTKEDFRSVIKATRKDRKSVLKQEQPPPAFPAAGPPPIDLTPDECIKALLPRPLYPRLVPSAPPLTPGPPMDLTPDEDTKALLPRPLTPRRTPTAPPLTPTTPTRSSKPPPRSLRLTPAEEEYTPSPRDLRLTPAEDYTPSPRDLRLTPAGDYTSPPRDLRLAPAADHTPAKAEQPSARLSPRPVHSDPDTYFHSDEVQRLKDCNFRPVIKNMEKTLVMFYDPRVPDCVIPSIAFSQVADQKYDNKWMCAAVNCATYPDLCRGEFVCRVPVVKMYSYGSSLGAVRDTDLMTDKWLSSFLHGVSA